MSTVPVTVEQQRQQVEMIWRAMLGSVAVYGVVCALVAGKIGALDESDVEWPRQVFSAVAVVLGMTSVWWRRHFLAADGSRTTAGLPFAQFQGYSVALWTLCEAVGVCGVVFTCMVRDAREFIPFGAAAAALLLLHRPSNLPWTRLSSSGGVQP